MHNLKKYNKTISGSFMYSNFYTDENIIFEYIDVFVYNLLYNPQNNHGDDDINKPLTKYINEIFDMDCCKISYDDNTVHVYDGSINHTTNVQLLILLNIIFSQKNINTENPITLYNSISYFHLKMLYCVYLYKLG